MFYIISCLLMLTPLNYFVDISILSFHYYKTLIYYLNNNVVNIYIIFFFVLFILRVNKWILLLMFPGGFYYFKAYVYATSLTFLPSLSVGWVLLHPIFFYSSLILILTVVSNPIVSVFRYSYTFLIFLLSSALVLGSYWGWSANVWGFYWLYDMVEIILLTLLAIVIFRIHSRSYLLHYYFWSFFLILMEIIVLRYGIFNTRHAFFVKNTTHYIPYVIVCLVLQINFIDSGNLQVFYHPNWIILSFLLAYPVSVRHSMLFPTCFILIYFLCLTCYFLQNWRLSLQILHSILFYAVMFLLIFVANYSYVIEVSDNLSYYTHTLYKKAYILEVWLNNQARLFNRPGVQTNEFFESKVIFKNLFTSKQSYLFNFDLELGESRRVVPLACGFHTTVYFHDTKLMPGLVDFDFTEHRSRSQQGNSYLQAARV